MKKILFLATMFLCLSSFAFAGTIDLSTWTQEGVSSAGNWVVSSGGSDVLQKINGDPTYFVSDTTYINTTFEGSFGVETTSDDDFIGFVFGFNGLNDYLLFDWKQKTQTYSGKTAQEGFSLSKISGTDVDFWKHTGADITILDSSYSSTSGWVDNTVYDFTLDYTTTSITIDVGGTNIFDVTGTFSDGKFGFYNYSQSWVRYRGFEETVIPPSVPEPSTILLLGAGLLGLAGYNRKRFSKKK